MPRRPGESGGDTDGSETRADAGQSGAELLGSHFHAGPLTAAPLHPTLKKLLAFWNEKRGKRAMPARGELPVYEFKPWFGYLAILEPAPATFRFRLGGTELIGRFGREVTGLTLADLPVDQRKALHAMIDLVTAKQAPLAAATSMRIAGQRTLWSELMLPLSGDRTGSTLLLLGSYPMRAGK